MPWNIWAANGVTGAALNYLQAPGVQNGRTEQTVYGGTLSADLGQYGWRLPGARNGIAHDQTTREFASQVTEIGRTIKAGTPAATKAFDEKYGAAQKACEAWLSAEMKKRKS